MPRIISKNNTAKSGGVIRVVVVGGGTGIFSVLTGLKKYPLHLSAIVSMADDGGSSGILREEFGILPPGDIRRALVALSSHPNEFLSKLFSYRFEKGGMSGHNFGNLILTVLERITGSFENAIREASRLLDVRGNVIPVTFDSVRLCAELEDGSVIKGETNIDIPKHDGALKIKRIWLMPRARPSWRAIEAIKEADFIIIGPGDLFTSVLPNLVVGGMVEALRKSKAKKIYVCNLMTKFGETHGFSVEGFIDTVTFYLGDRALDFAIVDSSKPSGKALLRYKRHKAFLVRWSGKSRASYKGVKIVNSPLLRQGNLLRHDPRLLGRLLMRLFVRG